MKTYYLNLSFYDGVSRNKICASKIEIAGEIDISNYTVDELTGIITITDKNSIDKIVEFLNTIPLNLSFKKEVNLENGKDVTMIFYDNKEMCIGWINIDNDAFIQRSSDLKVFKVRGENLGIIEDLERLCVELNGDMPDFAHFIH